MTEQEQAIIPVESITDTIQVIRGQKVILASDLARLYGVETKQLNQAVKRNLNRFPGDFFFQLTPEEKEEVVTNCDHLHALKFSPVLPYAFTEHGAVMVATILSTPRAAEVSIYVVRAFVRLRELLRTNADLSDRLDELEARLETRLDTHDQEIGMLIQMIRELMIPVETDLQRRIGYRQPKDEG